MSNTTSEKASSTHTQQNKTILEQQFALLNSMYKNLPVGIIIYDSEGNLLSLNRKSLETLGITDHQPQFNIFEEPNMPQEIKATITNGEDVEYEQEYPFNDVTRRYLNSSRSGSLFFHS